MRGYNLKCLFFSDQPHRYNYICDGRMEIMRIFVMTFKSNMMIMINPSQFTKLAVETLQFSPLILTECSTLSLVSLEIVLGVE